MSSTDPDQDVTANYIAESDDDPDNDDMDLSSKIARARPSHLKFFRSASRQLTLEGKVERIVLHAMKTWDGITPLTYNEAMAGKDKEHWLKAIQEEFNNLNSHGTWEVMDYHKMPDGAKPIGCKWVFKVKLNPDGSVERYKARLVAQGFSQRYGIDYDETYAPVIQISSLRTLVSLAVIKSLEMDMMDITGAYLNGKLQETIFMRTPEGFNSSGKVLKLKMSLYGLKQAGRTWYECINEFLTTHLGFIPASGDKCVFIKQIGERLCIVALYVDDLIVMGDRKAVDRVKASISEKFDARDLGALNYALGIHFERRHDGNVLMFQEKYIKECLKRFGMEECNGISTPMEKRSMTVGKDTLGPRRTTDIDGPVEDPLDTGTHPYMSLIGALMYASVCTRPDISHAVNLLARYNNDPCVRHWTAAKRVLRYLKYTSDLGIHFKKEQSANDRIHFKVYTDAAESDIENSLGQTGVIELMNGNLTYYQSSKQSTPHSAITEAENMALLDGHRQALATIDFAEDVGIDIQLPNPILIDSKSVVDRIKNGRVTRENKHLLKRYNTIRHEVAVTKKVSVEHIAGADNPADMMTKSLTVFPFIKHRRSIGMEYARVFRGEMNADDIDKISDITYVASRRAYARKGQ